jgi:hypothetical protein
MDIDKPVPVVAGGVPCLATAPAARAPHEALLSSGIVWRHKP